MTTDDVKADELSTENLSTENLSTENLSTDDLTTDDAVPASTAPDDVTEGTYAAPPSVGAPRRSRATNLLVGGSALLLVGLVALLVLTAISLGNASDAKSQQTAAREATNAASKDLPIFGSYGYATIAADQKKAEAVFVPSLRSNYEKLIAPRLQTLQQKKVIVKVNVQQAQAVHVTSATSVQVLAFFLQTTSSPTMSSPQVVPNAYALTMQKVGGAWLVAGVNPAS